MSDGPKVVPFVPREKAGREGMLAALESLRQQIDSGEVVMFLAVGLSPKDDVHMVLGGDGRSKAAMLGGLEILRNVYMNHG